LDPGGSLEDRSSFIDGKLNEGGVDNEGYQVDRNHDINSEEKTRLETEDKY